MPIAAVPVHDIFAWFDRELRGIRNVLSPAQLGFLVGATFGQLGEEQGWELLRAIDSRCLLDDGANTKQGRLSRARCIQLFVDAGIITSMSDRPPSKTSAEKAKILIAAGWQAWEAMGIGNYGMVDDVRVPLYYEGRGKRSRSTLWWHDPPPRPMEPEELVTLGTAWRRHMKLQEG